MADEYISKHEAYKTLKDLEAAYIYLPIKEAYATAARRIDEIKAADVKPVKRGKWISLDYDTYFECSECKNIEDIESNFCPRCGADMQNREWLKR